VSLLLALQRPLAAAVVAASLASASATVTRPLSAQVTGAASVLGAAQVTRQASAGVAGQSGTAASLAVSRALAATVAARSEASAAAALRVPLAGNVGAASSLAASLRAGAHAPTGTVATLTLGTSSATTTLADSLGTAALASSVAAADLAASLATLTVAASVATAETAVSYTIVAGDTLPALTATLKVNGTVVNLTGATVALRWSCGGTRGDLAGSVTDATGGVCAFDLSSLPSGSGRGEIVVTFADDEQRTFPSAEAFPIVVRAAI